MQQTGLETQTKVGRKKSADKRKYHDNSMPKKEYEERKYKRNPELEIAISKEEKPRKEKIFKWTWNISSAIKERALLYCQVCHHCLYEHSARIFASQNYNIFNFTTA